MRDIFTASRVKKLHPAIAEEVEKLINEIESGWPETMAVRIVQGLRTFPEQDALYQQGRTTQGPRVTNAKAGQSYHNYGLAIDFCIMYDLNGDGKYEKVSWDMLKDFDKDGRKDWMQVVSVFVVNGYTWGGNFKSLKDNPHLEKTFGLNWKEMLRRYNNEEFIPNTKYIRL